MVDENSNSVTQGDVGGVVQDAPQQSDNAQNIPSVDAYNIWAENKTVNNKQEIKQPVQPGAKKEVPVENRIAMYQRLLEKNNKQLAEMQSRLDYLLSQQSMPNNTQKRKNMAMIDSFEDEKGGLDASVYELLDRKLEEKFSSLEEKQFFDRVVTNAEKYISRIQNLPQDVSDRFLEVVQSEKVVKGLKDGLIGFEDIYKILTYDKLLEKLNSLITSQQNKQNLNMSAGGGSSGGDMQEGALSDEDFFAKNPDKALDVNFVMEYKKKKGIL